MLVLLKDKRNINIMTLGRWSLRRKVKVRGECKRCKMISMSSAVGVASEVSGGAECNVAR
jgi:hypothetical protein